MKNVAMIPVRMGSKRVPNKNLRMIDGRPLVWYIANAVIQSGQFDKKDIYINSESDVCRGQATSTASSAKDSQPGGTAQYARPLNAQLANA